MSIGPIRFGTSGWRAVIGEEFTFAHVGLVTQAIADYLTRRSPGRGLQVVVGYDTRFLSPEFAEYASAVLARAGFQVWRSDRDIPTPVVGYQIVHRQADGGINITASHNPPEYNGIKFSEAHGGPAAPEVTRQIEREIHRLLRRRVPLLSEEEVRRWVRQDDRVRLFDARPAYVEQIKRLIKGDLIKKAKLTVAVDCMYGTVRGYLDHLLEAWGCRVIKLHDRLNPSFDGHPPNPHPTYLTALIETVKRKRCDLGLAADCDGDRFAIVDRTGRVMPANEMIVLYLAHLIRTRPKRHAVARSVSTTHLVDAVAQAHGLEVIETPVGFKYLGPHLLKGECLMIAEESGGMSIAGHLPEKDGILACLLACEIAALSRKSLTQQFDALQRQHGPFYSANVNVPLDHRLRAGLLNKLERLQPVRIGNVKVVRTGRLDGFKYYLADGSWVLIRPSGTEPLLRFQMESPSQPRLRELQAAVKRLIAVSKKD